MRPEVASSAAGAILALGRAFEANDPFAIALVDGQMPEVDGLMLVEKIRRDRRFRPLKICFLTSAAHPEQIKRARQLGVSGYLIKPVKQSELFHLIVSSMIEATPAALPKKPKPRKQSRLQVLLAEDNPINQKLQRRLLEKLGHTVTIVENGKEAVSAADSEAFDLIILDVQMPEMDGLEAASIMRSRQNMRGRIIPIMALTAHAAAEDRERCCAAGMDAYLSKPLRIADLEKAIGNLFQNAAEPKSRKRKLDQSSSELIDERKVLEGLGGDRDLLVDILRLFLEDSDRLLRNIRSAIAHPDSVALERSAHALKGSIANLTTGDAARYAAELEKMGRSGDCAAAEELMEKLVRALGQLQHAASDLLRKRTRVPRKRVKTVSGAA